MRVQSYFLVVAFLVGLAGCTKQADVELEQKNAQLNSDLAARDQYIEEVVSAINSVYSDLEAARAKQKRMLKEAESREKMKTLSSADIRQQVMHRIADIGNVLQESRKRIAGLESKLRSSTKQYQSLDEMVANLKKTLEEREQMVAQLEEAVRVRDGQLSEKLREIAEKDSQIRDQQNAINTAYYIVGTRRELKEKGIIEDEGGFLWGLLGSTTILSSGVDESYFRPIDKSAATTLTIEGEVDEIIPKRNEEFYQTDIGTDESTTVKIVDPKKFWQDKYLVIITG